MKPRKAPLTLAEIDDGTQEQNEMKRAWTYEQIANGYVNDYAMSLMTKQTPTDAKDIIGDITVMVLEIPTSKFMQIINQCKSEKAKKNQWRRYLAGIIHRQIVSTTSYMYHKYKQHDNREIAFTVEGMSLECAEIILKDNDL